MPDQNNNAPVIRKGPVRENNVDLLALPRV